MNRSPGYRLASLLVGFGALTPSLSHGSQDLPPQLELPATTACLENALARGIAAHTLSGFAVAIVRDGHVVYHRGFGTVSPTSAQPVTTDTRFRFGSVTKSMTSTALLSYVDEGRIRLHAPVTRLLPGLSLYGGEPGWTERVTPHLLLSHQSGIQDFADDPPISPDDGALAAAFYDPNFLQRIPFLVKPGTLYNYSNPGFSLAGLLVETAAGRPYREVMRRRVFEPLGMTRSVFLPSEVLADNDYARGIFEGQVVPTDDAAGATLRPAGTTWGSVDDLAQFMKFLMRGNPQVLSPRLWRAMQTRHVNTEQLFDLEGYGYGLVVEDSAGINDSERQIHLYDGVKVVWHDGAIKGFRSLMSTFPTLRFGYAVLINGDIGAPATDPAPCYQAAINEAVGSRLPAPSPWPGPDIQRDHFVDYVGDYTDRIDLTGEAIVSLATNGDLTIRFPKFDAVGLPYDPILHPLRRDNFELVVNGASYLLTGIRKHGSEVKYLRTRFTVMERIDTAASAPLSCVGQRCLPQRAGLKGNPVRPEANSGAAPQR